MTIGQQYSSFMSETTGIDTFAKEVSGFFQMADMMIKFINIENSTIIERSSEQKRVHEIVTDQDALIFFPTNNSGKVVNFIFALLSIRSQKLLTTVEAPRRFGKTFGTNPRLAGLAVFGSVSIAVSRHAERAARAELDDVWKYMLQIPGVRERIVKNSEDTKKIRSFHHEDVIIDIFAVTFSGTSYAVFFKIERVCVCGFKNIKKAIGYSMVRV